MSLYLTLTHPWSLLQGFYFFHAWAALEMVQSSSWWDVRSFCETGGELHIQISLYYHHCTLAVLLTTCWTSFTDCGEDKACILPSLTYCDWIHQTKVWPLNLCDYIHRLSWRELSEKYYMLVLLKMEVWQNVPEFHIFGGLNSLI